MRALGNAAAAAAVAWVLGAAACSRPPRPPDLGFHWPRAGMTVSPGEEIRFRLAVDVPGHYAFQLARTGAGPIGRAEGAGIATIPWQVPPDATPGERIDFTASARHAVTNLVGNAATHVLVAGVAAEDWHGTWTGAAKGNVYDDEAWVLFDFTIAPDGAVAGKGRAKLFARPVSRGGCTYTHAPAPAEFDVTVGGRREDGHVALRLTGPGLVGTRTVTRACADAGATTKTEAGDAFGRAAVFAAGLAPRVPIGPGRLRVATTDTASGMEVEYTTTIARGRRR